MKKQSRRTAMKLFAALAASGSILSALPAKAAGTARKWWTPTSMDAMTALRTRRSVRSYTSQDVSEEQINELLGAAMSAPSAGNEQPWEFVVIRDKNILSQVKRINKYAGYAAKSPVSILVCGDLERDKFGGYWIEDVSAATQNILLAAHAMGLGAVWTGIYPMTDRVEKFRDLVKLPEHIVPMALVVIGHPKKAHKAVNRFKPERIHKDTFKG
ncbi:nitroreductase family protein [Desulfovibrio sp. JC010]|uniref:nitroreductase family protein n=1 Tax=Desulfovibrio sp. JC010 TaxID=2593641 RepID=UPI0027D257F9|nr:nitroreductase family protein [Desulfovibrio sp. JC010]